METFLVSAAYKHVAIMLMLAQVNFFAEKVNLPLERPVTERDVRSGSHVSPPRLMGFGGSIVTDQYFFGFGKGRLANFKKRHLEPDTDTGIRKRNLELAEAKSLIGTNEAYQLATNWLTALQIDVEAVEKGYPSSIRQRVFYPDAQGFDDSPELRNRDLLLPIFDIQWGSIPMQPAGADNAVPALSVTILGSTKELIEFHLVDQSLSRSPVLSPDTEALLAIRDEDFKSYNSQQKSNLVARFSVYRTLPENSTKPRP